MSEITAVFLIVIHLSVSVWNVDYRWDSYPDAGPYRVAFKDETACNTKAAALKRVIKLPKMSAVVPIKYRIDCVKIEVQ